MEVRLGLRTREERARALHDRAGSLEASAQAELVARERQAARLERRRHEAQVAEAVRVAATYAAKQLAVAAETADRHRQRAEAERAQRETELAVVRRELAGSRRSCAS